MAPSDSISVFVSSTSEDLGDYRAVVRNVILDMGWQPRMMEHMGTSTKPTAQACLDLVRQCQLLVLIVAWRQGWVPRQDQGGNDVDSITALELRCAREADVPVIALLADDNWPGRLWEKEQGARDWIERFRAELNQPAVFFGHEDDESLTAFRATVRGELVAHRERLIVVRSQRAQSSDALEHFDDACEGLLGGNNIPFIGADIYGEGPLSSTALALALAAELDDEHENLTLATAAEYRERRLGSRAVFLEEFEKIIVAQSEQAPNCAAYDVIAQTARPQLIVSATFDRLLEERLFQAGVICATVAHIVHSFDGRDDGKILVLRRGEPAEICLADKVDVGDAECVIYKPLGSPLLHRGLDEDLEIDTVVVTESDHLTFLGRLEHETTQIPTRFSRLLQSRPLLFLGYGLDFWHFRLVMEVFQSLGGRRRRASTIAVRRPASRMEELIWQRLGADLIPIAVEEFAERVAAEVKEAG